MKQVVKSEKSAKALGPYSAGIAIDSFVFLSGQLGIDQNGDSGGVPAGCKYVFRYLRRIPAGLCLCIPDVFVHSGSDRINTHIQKLNSRNKILGGTLL